MHDLILQNVIDACRKREQEGDCLVTPAPSQEYLEMAVVQLADKKTVCLSRELFDKMLEFIKNRSGASAWWNDTRTYNLVTEIDEETGIGR